MFGLGFSEILVLAVLALILLGPEQLPDVARKIGRFVNELKKTTDGLKEEFRNTGLDPSRLLDEIKRESPPQAPAQAPENTQGTASAVQGTEQKPVESSNATVENTNDHTKNQVGDSDDDGKV